MTHASRYNLPARRGDSHLSEPALHRLRYEGRCKSLVVPWSVNETDNVGRMARLDGNVNRFVVVAGFVAIGHLLARKRGLNPVFRGVKTAVFGPLILPSLLSIKSKKRAAD